MDEKVWKGEHFLKDTVLEAQQEANPTWWEDQTCQRLMVLHKELLSYHKREIYSQRKERQVTKEVYQGITRTCREKIQISR